MLIQWSAATCFDDLMAALGPAMELLANDKRGHAQALLREYRTHCQQAGEWKLRVYDILAAFVFLLLDPIYWTGWHVDMVRPDYVFLHIL